MAVCQRRSPVRAERIATSPIAIVVTRKGRTATKLVAKLLSPDSDWITLGNHKVIPYMVVETPKYTRDSIQILGALRTCQKFPCLRLDSACSSPASFSSSHLRSSPFNQQP